MNWNGFEIRCPTCRGDLSPPLRCLTCRIEYPVELDIPDLRVFPDPYIDPENDRAKGRLLAARFSDLGLEGLVRYYYSITPAVTPAQARMFTAGVLAAPERAEAALDAWGARPGGGDFLEIGSGTAPLLVAARRRFARVAGVDISFRWSVVGRKRMEEAGVDIPVFCACAEALPFEEASFDHVAMESTLEMVSDQRAALAECRRVLRPGGAVFLFTPNRYSLGPDPHLGLWCGGMLPERWTSAWVRRRGGVPPVRQLLGAGDMRRLLAEAGFRDVRISLPAVTPSQRAHMAAPLRLAADAYTLARMLPVASAALRLVGPALYAVARG